MQSNILEEFTQKILVEKSETKRLLGKTNRKWKDNIRMNLRYIVAKNEINITSNESIFIVDQQ